MPSPACCRQAARRAARSRCCIGAFALPPTSQWTSVLLKFWAPKYSFTVGCSRFRYRNHRFIDHDRRRVAAGGHERRSAVVAIEDRSVRAQPARGSPCACPPACHPACSFCPARAPARNDSSTSSVQLCQSNEEPSCAHRVLSMPQVYHIHAEEQRCSPTSTGRCLRVTLMSAIDGVHP